MKELSVCGKSKGLGGWDVVGPQCFFRTLDPGLPWSSPCLVPWHLCVVSYSHCRIPYFDDRRPDMQKGVECGGHTFTPGKQRTFVLLVDKV